MKENPLVTRRFGLDDVLHNLQIVDESGEGQEEGMVT